MFPSLVKPCLSCLFRRIARCNGSVDTLLTADHISSSSWSKYAQPLEKLCSKHSKANVGAPPWSRRWNGHGRTEKWAPTLEVTDRSCEIADRVDARVAQAHDVQELARREPLQVRRRASHRRAGRRGGAAGRPCAANERSRSALGRNLRVSQGQDLESPVLQPGRGPRRRVRAPVRRRIDAAERSGRRAGRRGGRRLSEAQAALRVVDVPRRDQLRRRVGAALPQRRPARVLRRADLSPMNRGAAAATTYIFCGRVAAAPRLRRGYSAETRRDGAAAATWIFLR